MTITLPALEPWQKEVYDWLHTYPKDTITTVLAKRQCGKSILCIMVALTYSLESKTINIIIEPTLHQCRRVYQQILEMLVGSNLIRNSNSQTLEITFINGSQIIFKSAEQGNALRGLTCSGILILDECAYIPDNVIEILLPIVDARKCPILAVSTPLFTSGYFYEFFKDERNHSYNWNDYDTSKYLSREKLEYYRKKYAPIKFKTEYLGQFITEGGYVFEKYEFSDTIKKPVCCGIDWGVNNDYTFLTFLDEDGQTTDVWYSNTLPPVDMIDRVSTILNGSGVNKVEVEMNSIGSVYKDMLQRKLKSGIQLTTFNTSNDTKRGIIENLQTALANGACKVKDDVEVTKQLNTYACDRTTTGKVTYNGLGEHDDAVMSLAIAYHCLTSNRGTFNFGLMPSKKHRRIDKYAKYYK